MKQLKILGYGYSLDLSKNSDGMGGNIGLTHFDHKYLQIANDLDQDMKNSTLIHELIEALNYHLELNLQHPQIMALEVGLHQVLNDNGVDLSVLSKE